MLCMIVEKKGERDIGPAYGALFRKGLCIYLLDKVRIIGKKFIRGDAKTIKKIIKTFVRDCTCVLA